MKLNHVQSILVTQNLKLVHKVIHDKVHNPHQLGIFAYDDLFQIGCIGLCKAAVTDKGGVFSTYAYRLIWHEICSALEYASVRSVRESLMEPSEMVQPGAISELPDLGYVDLEDPASINLYAASFESKDTIESAIASYNENVEELSQIHYTDYIGIMMSSVTSIINAITYVLIAFVAISLVVSSIMIGVITLISVQERTKEIGILRAIGASKRNVSGMFNAETMIIGFTSGLLGVLITYVLCIPINAIIQHLTGIEGLSAYLPVPVAIVLVLISMGLTLISGIIPSRSAAKKDPVVALRTE